MSQAINEARAAAVAEMETLAQLEELSAEQEARFDELKDEVADLDKRKDRLAVAEAARAAQPETDARSAAKPASAPVTPQSATPASKRRVTSRVLRA